MIKLNDRGFHVVEAVIIICTVFIIGFVGWRVTHKPTVRTMTTDDVSQPVEQESAQSTSEPVLWQRGADESWSTVGGVKPPDCPSPLVLDPPVDLSKAESILYPGQTRGGNYKPHGGFGMKGGNAYDVKAPIDGYLTGGVRYMEAGELQYKFDFTNSCGIRFMFDHLMEMSPAMQKIVETMPPANEDTRTNWTPQPVLFKKGDLIATKVGHTGNVGFDFGVYDLRQPNEASKNASYAAAQRNFAATTYYAVCWLDWFEPSENALIAALPSRDMKMGKTSDYCK